MRYLLVLMGLALCMGQSCAGPATMGDSSPADGIPEGLYVGTGTCNHVNTITDAYGSFPDVYTRSEPVTKQFGPDGLVVNSRGEAVEIGDVAQVNSGLGGLTSRVTSVRTSEGRYVMTANDEGLIASSTYSAYVAGTRQESFSLQANGSVAYELYTKWVGSAADGSIADLSMTCTATLLP